MMIDPTKEARKLEKARSQSFLPLVCFPLLENLQSIRRRLFAHITMPVDFYFVGRGPLACICICDSRATIYGHQVLNYEAVPAIVLDMIFVHELLHLDIPPRMVEGRLTPHPPEFWQREKELFPGRVEASTWIARNLLSCLKRRPRLEAIDVLPHWKKHWCARSLDRSIHLAAKQDFEAT